MTLTSDGQVSVRLSSAASQCRVLGFFGSAYAASKQAALPHVLRCPKM